MPVTWDSVSASHHHCEWVMRLCLDHCVYLWTPLRELPIEQSKLGMKKRLENRGWCRSIWCRCVHGKTSIFPSCSAQSGSGTDSGLPKSKPSCCASATLSAERGLEAGCWEGRMMLVRPPRARSWTWVPSHCRSQFSRAEECSAALPPSYLHLLRIPTPLLFNLLLK